MNLSERLIAAIEGECDGLAITAEQASNILAYLQYGTSLDDVRRIVYAAPQPSPTAVVLDDERAAFDVALTALADYQRYWDTGLPAEYAQSERIAMECAVEAVREVERLINEMLGRT